MRAASANARPPLFATSLLRILASEFLFPRPFVRVPEADAVMVDAESVRAYAAGGDRGGVFEGLYFFHALHASQEVRPGETLLDLGCGAAKLLLELAALNPRTRFLGVDASAAMVETAREARQHRGLENVDLRLDNILGLRTVPDRAVDAVMCTAVLHQLETHEQFEHAFAEIARVLKPGGGVYIADFGQLRSSRTVDALSAMLTRDQPPRLAADFASSVRAAFSREEFERITRRTLGSAYRVYVTAPVPFLIVVKSRRPRNTDVPASAADVTRLTPRRRDDVRRLTFFFRLGGLRTPR